MGVVFGETAEIGDGCTIYQGVTLGGTSLSHGKRHPTLGRNVVVGVNSSVLGAIVLGDNAKVGGGSVVVKDVPANATVVGVPARVVAQDGKPIRVVSDRPQVEMPDPTTDAIARMQRRLNELEQRLPRWNRAKPAKKKPGAGLSEVAGALKLYNTRTRSVEQLHAVARRRGAHLRVRSDALGAGTPRPCPIVSVLRRVAPVSGASRLQASPTSRTLPTSTTAASMRPRRPARTITQSSTVITQNSRPRCASSACWNTITSHTPRISSSRSRQ